MLDIPRVFLVAREDLLRAKLCALADQCHPPVQLATAVDCLEAQNAMADAAPDILFIAVAEEVLVATDQDNLDFATYIHEQEVGNVGALLEWVRHRPRPMKVGLLYPGPRSMGPSLMLRLMGCNYVFAENELREYFAQIIYEFWKANAATDRLTNPIFLSYVRSDASRVSPLYERLKKLQLVPWLDVNNLYPGEEWNPRIESVIRGAAFFVPFFSHESTIKRGVFRREIHLALQVAQERFANDCYIIPALLEDCQLPDELRPFHQVNILERDGLTRLLQTIVQGIYRRIPHGRGEEILIVDEDKVLRTQYEFTLRQAGYHPVLYDHPSCAQNAFEGRSYPVVILDLMGGEGISVLWAVQPWSLTTKVIVTTRPGDPSIAHFLPYIFRCLPKRPEFLSEIRLYVHEALQALRLHS